ncbi:unnamed protein product [Fusarium graminearum]|uniref:Chromosome 1, complete genome n=1 Tax=Gibberella zeae (strain ATCC MYA-4620 / CBS 123657 / FGSC 9075 / NRRL 31084 / PH-1) TaxID=229533 RepID=A0A098DDZ6_GIBZE|nr:unnamed protein product [Fusarium graminearum]
MAKTTTINLNDFMTNIPWVQLSSTYQDAITICCRLGIFYLWIDSLCIIQDSKDDWKDQASQMADIYESSFITIAATRSNDGSEGCFVECDEKYLAKLVPGYRNIYVRQMPPLFPSDWCIPRNCNDWPLLNRGWIYQEMMLSQRILHFCANEVRSESGGNDHQFSQFRDRRVFRKLPYRRVPYAILRQEPRYLWYRTVQEYSRLQLNFESDKMPALGGLTKRMQTMRPNDRYLAGLWEKTLLFDLLWSVWPGPVAGRRKNPQFPSWSWASVSCQVMWHDLVDSTLDSVRVEEVRLLNTGPSHLGELLEAAITIRAPFTDASLFRPQWRSLPVDVSNDNITRVDQLCVYDDEADCLPYNLSAARYNPEPGPSTTNDVFAAIHVQLRPGGKCYERIGYGKICHPSTLILDTEAASVKEMLEALPTSTIVVV